LSEPTRHPLEALLLDDRQHGASELARLCLKELAELVENDPASDPAVMRDGWQTLALRLRDVRPSMAPVRNLLERWVARSDALDASSADRLRAQAARAARDLIAESEEAVGTAAERAASLIGPGRTIITHSLSSTVLACFRRLAPDVRAIVTESRPPGEGRALARELSEIAIATDFITDQQLGVFTARADCALVGADTVAFDGTVINKAGTRLLALAARADAIPFYVCFEGLKRLDRPAAEVPLERHNPAELGGPELPHVTPRNVYFDRTAPELVSAWITEKGVVWAGDP
jgi:ribose 1,5-bisphosphate isomerase